MTALLPVRRSCEQQGMSYNVILRFMRTRCVRVCQACGENTSCKCRPHFQLTLHSHERFAACLLQLKCRLNQNVTESAWKLPLICHKCLGVLAPPLSSTSEHIRAVTSQHGGRALKGAIAPPGCPIYPVHLANACI